MQICTPLGRVNELIAKDSGVSARQVSKIETILRKAPKGLRDRVLAGRTNINRAYNQIKTKERPVLRKNYKLKEKIDPQTFNIFILVEVSQ